MRPKPKRVPRKARALPQKARADFAGTLLRSLDAKEEDRVDIAWKAEVMRRLREIESGEARLIPWTRVRRQLESTVSRGPASVRGALVRIGGKDVEP